MKPSQWQHFILVLRFLKPCLRVFEKAMHWAGNPTARQRLVDSTIALKHPCKERIVDFNPLFFG